MSRLTDLPPSTVDIGGVEWPINTAFWAGIEFERTITDPELTSEQKVAAALTTYYGDNIPADVERAVDALLWFFRCGADPEKPAEENAPATMPKRAYDFDQDAEYIFAAFWQTYGIDLWSADLHWWKFHALFTGLPEECRISQIMGYRTADTRGMSKGEKKRYERLKKIYALKKKTTVEHAISLEERDRMWKARIDAAYAKMEEKKGLQTQEGG